METTLFIIAFALAVALIFTYSKYRAEKVERIYRDGEIKKLNDVIKKLKS